MLAQQRVDRRRVARIGDEGHIHVGRALEHLECDVTNASLRARQRHIARIDASGIGQIGERAVGRGAVDGDDRLDTREVANRLEAGQRIVIHFSQ